VVTRYAAVSSPASRRCQQPDRGDSRGNCIASSHAWISERSSSCVPKERLDDHLSATSDVQVTRANERWSGSSHIRKMSKPSRRGRDVSMAAQ
jgi:hypothetical protein